MDHNEDKIQSIETAQKWEMKELEYDVKTASLKMFKDFNENMGIRNGKVFFFFKEPSKELFTG